MEERIKKLEDRNDCIKELREKMMRCLEEKKERREKNDRKNNIIIRGEEMTCRGTPREMIQEILKRELQVEVEIMEAFWIKRETEVIY